MALVMLSEYIVSVTNALIDGEQSKEAANLRYEYRFKPPLRILRSQLKRKE